MHPWNANQWPFLCVYWFPKTQISAIVDVGFQDQLKHEGFSHMRRWREEGGGSGRKTAALSSSLAKRLPTPPSQAGCRERTLLRLQRRVGRGWEELESTPKGADSQRVSGRVRLPCVEGQHGWHVEIKIKQHASTLNYSYK